ncbi:hypothetical protein P4O66_014467 [Electrophorus voltai]|uniref:Uncharacterized protein n=1 Tax=Electrophorus voltai TaxID=2609070 RepID=A0AAD9DSZ3_9TELE|nr:hypothetical protein P4O66_014467 [Electrophorus voltai]
MCLKWTGPDCLSALLSGFATTVPASVIDPGSLQALCSGTQGAMYGSGVGKATSGDSNICRPSLRADRRFEEDLYAVGVILEPTASISASVQALESTGHHSSSFMLHAEVCARSGLMTEESCCDEEAACHSSSIPRSTLLDRVCVGDAIEPAVKRRFTGTLCKNEATAVRYFRGNRKQPGHSFSDRERFPESTIGIANSNNSEEHKDVDFDKFSTDRLVDGRMEEMEGHEEQKSSQPPFGKYVLHCFYELCVGVLT